jgi:putative tryptophan/tyrosine transport system substrate-binding protein
LRQWFCCRFQPLSKHSFEALGYRLLSLGENVQRREFITLVGSAAAVWPLAARAQQPAMPVVGFLHDGSSDERAHLVAAFRQGLIEAGYIEGRNVLVEYRWAQDQYDRLPALVTELVQRHVAVIATPGSIGAALAAKAATNTIPIVFSVGTDPVKLGLVASLNRPGGNVTGVSYLTQELGPKRLALLRELMPGGADVVVLANPKSAPTDYALQDMQAAAATVGQRLSVLRASNNQEIGAAFLAMVQRRAPALVIVTDPLVSLRIDRDILDHFQEAGPGWQDRINEALRKVVGK